MSKAPEPKQLTKEEEIAHARAVVAQLTLKGEKELEEISKGIREKGLGNHVYDADSKVEISGALFAHMLNFFAMIRENGDNLRMIFGDIVYAQDSITLGALDFQTELAKLHIENCEKGIAKVAKEEKPKVERPKKATPKVTRKNS